MTTYLDALPLDALREGLRKAEGMEAEGMTVRFAFMDDDGVGDLAITTADLRAAIEARA